MQRAASAAVMHRSTSRHCIRHAASAAAAAAAALRYHYHQYSKAISKLRNHGIHGIREFQRLL